MYFCFSSSLNDSLFSFPYSLGTFNKFLPLGALKLKRFQASTHSKLDKTSPDALCFRFQNVVAQQRVKKKKLPFNTHLSIYGSVLYHHPLVIPKVFMLTQTNNCVKIRELVVFRQEAEMPLQSLSWVYLGGWECDHLACVSLVAWAW